MNNRIIKNLLRKTVYTIRHALGSCLIAAMVCASCYGQQSTGGATPLAIQGGAPAGSFALSNLENVNLFNGNLNFRLPLLSVGGRGSAQHIITLPIEQKWFVEKIPLGQTGQFLYTYNDYEPGILRSGYGPGVMQAYRSGFFPQTCALDDTVTFSQTLTKLIFSTSDGTEYEFFSANLSGVAQVQNCNPTSYNRGGTFRTIDGSGMTFISDYLIQDIPFAEAIDPTQPFFPSGYVLMTNGTRLRIENGLVRWERDRNGNRITFNYDQNARVNNIQDSLNRTVTINYGVVDGDYGTTDQIIYSGYEGAQRIIRVAYSSLSNALRTTQPGDPTPGQTCVDPNSNTYNPNVVSSVWLPDGRRYILTYNCFGELARVVLPTGGSWEYDHGAGLNNSASNGTFERPAAEGGTYPQIYRRVLEKRSYPDGTTLAGKISFGRSETFNPAVFNYTSDQGFVQVDERNETGTLITRHKHYFMGSASPSLSLAPGYNPPSQLEGNEWKTERVDSDGSTILTRVTHDWTNDPAVFGQGPHITQTTITLIDTNQVAATTFNYDQFNNQTDIYEYDFGNGAPGAFVRRSHTDYLVTNDVNQTDYTATSIYLRSLPSKQWVSTDLLGNNKISYVIYEYDKYVDDTRHKPLVVRPSITGHDAAYSSVTTRGNVTGVTSYTTASSQTGPITRSTQYDVAGNPVVSIDAVGNKTTLHYDDSFCNGVTCAGTFTPNTYAFVTSSTSPIPDPSGQYGSTTGLVTSNLYEFWTGNVFSSTDANNNTTNFRYNDSLDRLKAVIRPTGGGRTDLEYGDTIGNLFVRKLVDLDLTRRTDSYQYFDGFGRPTESRLYEGGTSYIAVKQEYDALGRAYKRSNPFRPLQPESPVWTITEFDALGRLKNVRTPDNAVMNTGYKGNLVLVTDQAGKKRLTRTNAMGQVRDVWEITPNDPSQYPGIEPVSFGSQSLYGFLTHYDYNALDDLVRVIQGSQQRFFMYDSLKRLIRVRNPEQNAYAPISDITEPLTGNSAWSVKYSYDENGNLIQRTDARGVVSYVYDALNRNTTTNYSDTSINPDVTRIFDGAANGKGRLWASYAGGGESVGPNVEKTLFHSYDAIGRPVELRQYFKANDVWKAPYTITRTYNLANRITSQTYPSGHNVTYNYDSAGRLADKDALNPAFKGNLGDGNSPRTYSKGIIYAPSGQLAQEQFGTATSVYNKRFYNSRQQLAEILVSTTVGSDSWDRGKIRNQYSLQCSGPSCNATDNNGNLRKQEIFIPSVNPQLPATSWYQQYDYDELNRLKRVHEYTGNTALDWQQEFDYDRWGNRTINATGTWIGNQNNPPNPLLNETQFDTNILASTNRLQAPGDQPLPENQKRMRYDAAGNLINDTYTGAGERVYDAENRMIKAWGGDNQWQFYTYNADGQRTRRKINNQETWLVYGFDGELLAEYPADGATNNPTKEYGYRNGQLLLTAEAGSGGGTQNVNWTNAVGVSISGNNLTRTMAGDGWSTGARSSQMIASGDGYAEFTVTETNKKRSFGLTSNTSVTSYQHISYGMLVAENGQITIHEGIGVYGVFGTYTTGDKLRVSIEGGVVKYRKNGTLLRTSTLAPTYPLYAGASIYSNAGTITAAVITSGLHSALWTNATGVSISGNNLTRTMAGDGWSTGARSSQMIASGDGYAEFTVTETNKKRSFGLTSNTSVTSYQHISYGMLVAENGQITIHEGIGVYGVFGTYTTGDKLRVSIEGGVVKYRKNGTLLRTSTLAPTYPLYAGASIYSNAGTVNNAVLASGTIGSATQFRWLVADQLGTPRLILDETGLLANVKRHDYLPFGEELMSQGLRSASLGYATGDGVRQQFTQKERDVETGLDYFAARYYSSVQGRFTSVDSFGGLRVNPQTLNLYAYVNNNPLKFIDPTGHTPQDPNRPNPNKPCSDKDPCEADENDTIVTITEAPHYTPSDQEVYSDWWLVLLGRMSYGTYFSNYNRYVKWKQDEGFRQGMALGREVNKALEDPGVQFALMHFGTALSFEAQLEAGSIKLINKGFPHLKGTTTNCVNCAIALDATLAGRPASALPGPVQSLAVLEKEFATKFSAPTTLAKIEAEFARLGNGARGVVFGENVAGGAGHVVNVVNQGGTVRFLDGQTGKVANFDNLINFRFIRTN